MENPSAPNTKPHPPVTPVVSQAPSKSSALSSKASKEGISHEEFKSMVAAAINDCDFKCKENNERLYTDILALQKSFCCEGAYDNRFNDYIKELRNRNFILPKREPLVKSNPIISHCQPVCQQKCKSPLQSKSPQNCPCPSPCKCQSCRYPYCPKPWKCKSLCKCSCQCPGPCCCNCCCCTPDFVARNIAQVSENASKLQKREEETPIILWNQVKNSDKKVNFVARNVAQCSDNAPELQKMDAKPTQLSKSKEGPKYIPYTPVILLDQAKTQSNHSEKGSVKSSISATSQKSERSEKSAISEKSEKSGKSGKSAKISEETEKNEKKAEEKEPSTAIEDEKEKEMILLCEELIHAAKYHRSQRNLTPEDAIESTETIWTKPGFSYTKKFNCLSHGVCHNIINPNCQQISKKVCLDKEFMKCPVNKKVALLECDDKLKVKPNPLKKSFKKSSEDSQSDYRWGLSQKHDSF